MVSTTYNIYIYYISICLIYLYMLSNVKYNVREVVNKEFLVPRGLPGEVVTVGFGKVTEKRWPQGDLEIFVNPEVKKVRPSRPFNSL